MDLLDYYRSMIERFVLPTVRPVVYFALLLMPCTLFAQRTITLDECLNIAHKQSPTLFEAKQNYEIAFSNANAQKRTLYTHLDLSLTAPLYTDNTVPIFNPVTGLTDLLPNRFTQFGPGISINQPITWTGGTISVTGSLYRQTLIPPTGPQVNDYLGLTSISITQPLFKANELEIISHEADMKLADARAAYASAWASLNYNTERLFYTLYQAEEQLRIQQDNVQARQSDYDLAVNKFKAGLIAEVEELQLEADLAAARTDLFDKKRLREAAERDLEIQLGVPFEDSLTAALDTLPDVNVTIDRETAVRYALENREDMLAAQQQITYGEDNLAKTGNQRTIYASLTGNFGTSSEAQFVELAQDPYLNLNRGLSLSVTIPVFDWGEHSYQMEAAQSAIDFSETDLMLKKQQVKQEVLSAIDQIEAAREQVEVAKKSVEVAGKAYSLSRNRFDLGKITSQDLTLDQQRVTQAQLALLSAEVAEHLAFADLTQKTLFDFETGKPVTPEE